VVVVKPTNDAYSIGNNHVVANLAIAFDGAKLTDMDVIADNEPPRSGNFGANADVKISAYLHILPNGVKLENDLPQRAQARQKKSHEPLAGAGRFIATMALRPR
jgi:hypothetical protein